MHNNWLCAVSTRDQNSGLQIDALNKVGCKRIFTDQGVCGATIERQRLSRAIAATGRGDRRVPRLFAADVDLLPETFCYS
ncbi:recombinase family protein [Nitrosospira sp. Nsp11]|uniref:recombinase family protein n=1 Tax=Nitrosospira sp. Nsp11 TaxID=1855338 RepID=UPI0009F9EA93